MSDHPTESTLAAIADTVSAGVTSAAGPSRLDSLLDTAARHCRRLVDCRLARVWLARRGGRRLVTQLRGEDGAAVAELRLLRGESLAGRVLADPKVMRLAPSDPRPSDATRHADFRSALLVPLFRRGAAFAVIECLDRQGAAAAEGFTDVDVERLGVASEAIAIALDHALLTEEIERRVHEKEVLLEITKTLSGPLDLDAVIAAIFESLREVVQYDAAAVYLVNRKTLAIERVSGVGFGTGAAEVFNLRVGVGLVGWVAKTGEAVIVPDVRADSRYVAERPSTRSEIAAPLVLRGKTIGVFNLESDSEDAYHEGHLELLTSFAAQAAVAIERAQLTRELVDQRRLERELAIAREIQESFLPKRAPQVTGFEFAGTALTHTQVGGDYYDFIRVSDGRLGLAIADVSGKGIPAAILMAGFRMSLLAEIRNDFAIRAVMRKVNSLLHESTDRDKFVTAFYSVLDLKNRVLIYSNAGHNPPILLRQNGEVELLTDGGVALGVLREAEYEDRPFPLRDGDVLVLYTDGVTEAEGPMGEQFGTTRLEHTIAALRERGAQEILDGIVRAVLDWCGERGQNDDLTLMVVKVRPQADSR
ncbi:MAG: SpoIIE family protein phosphatase [Candidatus Eisenbacteria bacterium]|uniref:SpoIIE family protein phosphatase n=1 Tax=Eiseniibacteriota bacterium TaxID=2212470 RepID=A0A849SMZ8_UNCEI|nr:SpoIIE family protein phosphatase [Candidatus Eisenbacteria bacterium]